MRRSRGMALHVAVLCLLLSVLAPMMLATAEELSFSSDAAADGSFLRSLSGASLHSLEITATHAHDPTFFTQGLACDNDPKLATRDSTIELYEGTGVWGGTYVHKYTLPRTGPAPKLRLQSSIKLPGSIFGEGVCVANDKVLQLTWQNQHFYQYDKSVFASRDNGGFDTAVKPVLASSALYTRLRYPSSAATLLTDDPNKPRIPGWKEGWGMAWNPHSQRIFVSDGSSNIYIVSPSDMSRVEQRIAVHYLDAHGHRVLVDNLNELEYIPHPDSTPQADRGELFANYYESYCVLRINPESGLILGVLHADPTSFYKPRHGRHASVEAMNGLAFHTASQRLFLTGKLWRSIYEVTARPHATIRAPAGAWKLDLAAHCPRLTMGTADMSYWQKVLSETAMRGAQVDGTSRSKQKPRANQWTPLPPHSSAGKTFAATKAAEPTFDTRIKSPPRFTQRSSHYGEHDDASHAELSAETKAALSESEETATLLGHDDRHFDIDRYVRLEMRQMGRDARRAYRHEADASPETLDAAHAMISGDLSSD